MYALTKPPGSGLPLPSPTRTLSAAVGVLMPRNAHAAAYSALTLACAWLAWSAGGAAPGAPMRLYEGLHGERVVSTRCACGVRTAPPVHGNGCLDSSVHAQQCAESSALLQSHAPARRRRALHLAGPMTVFAQRAAGAGLVMMALVAYSLKDGADRQRLGATTFRCGQRLLKQGTHALCRSSVLARVSRALLQEGRPLLRC
jgi:hypothetical protein